MRLKKQQYHLEPPRGLMNDPNGLAYFNGRYYVFFQWNRFAKNHNYKEWGLFTSKDLLHWDFEGSALLPDQTYDQCGVYSGSGCVIDDQLYLFYTGNAKKDGRRKSSQCIAVTRDGHRFLKLGCVLNTPEEYTEHFRDPKVLRADSGGYFMLIGAQKKDGRGAIALCQSDDGLSWRYSRIYAQSRACEMIECPDLFRLDESYVLIFSPQTRNNREDICESSLSAYKIAASGDPSSDGCPEDLDDGYSLLDYGFDFYAPQTFTDEKGRQILFAWMSRMDDSQEAAFSQDCAGIHCLTMPRELHLKNGKLYQLPPEELYSMRGRNIPVSRQTSSVLYAKPEHRQFYLRIHPRHPLSSVSISLYGNEVSIAFDPEKQWVCLTRKHWVSKQPEYRYCSLRSLSDVEIWSDSSSLEIFLNRGEAVLSSRICPESEDLRIRMSGNMNESDIKIYELHHMEGEVYE